MILMRFGLFLTTAIAVFVSNFPTTCDAKNGDDTDTQDVLEERDQTTNEKLSVDPAVRYGTEISWPMQQKSPKRTYINDIQRSQKSAYQRYMNGCYHKFGRRACDDNEADRIATNARQPAFQRNFTSAGYAKVIAPSSFKAVQQFWDARTDDDLNPESWDAGSVYTNHWKQSTMTLDINGLDSKYRRMLVGQVQSVLERWCGIPLQATSMYGIRVYKKGSILAPHVDRIPLVISAIINVAQDTEEDWILELIGHDGLAANVTMQPGEMVLYESHSVIHGRPYALSGKHFANVFLHFEPRGYTEKLKRKMEIRSAKELFETALGKLHEENEETALRKASSLPPYLEHGSLEASRWQQEFAFVREKVTKKSKTRTSTNSVKTVHILASRGDLAQLKKRAAKEGGILNKADSNGWKPIHEAARAGETETIAYLIDEHKVDVNERTNNGEGGSPLWWAEHNNRHEAAALLRQHGAVAVAPFD